MEALKVNQVWREVDPRFDRFVRILSIGSSGRWLGKVEIRTVAVLETALSDEPPRWEITPRSRATWCARARFNGKRGGYELHEDV